MKSITVPKTKLTLNIEQGYQIESTAVLEEKGKKVLRHVSEYRYFSTDPDIVKVNRTTGKFVARKKGSCYIYVVANNGVYKRIKITVK